MIVTCPIEMPQISQTYEFQVAMLIHLDWAPAELWVQSLVPPVHVSSALWRHNGTELRHKLKDLEASAYISEQFFHFCGCRAPLVDLGIIRYYKGCPINIRTRCLAGSTKEVP